MKTILNSIFFLLTAAFASTTACAQAESTASRSLDIFVFAGLTSAPTGFGGSSNTNLTIAGTIGSSKFHGISRSTEIRTSIPLAASSVRESSLLGGLRFSHDAGAWVFYGDVLFGRGEITYGSGHFVPNSNVYYVASAVNVLSPGTGLVLRTHTPFAFRADAQFQRWSTPVSETHHAISLPVTFGVEYHLPCRQRGHPYSR